MSCRTTRPPMKPVAPVTKCFVQALRAVHMEGRYLTTGAERGSSTGKRCYPCSRLNRPRVKQPPTVNLHRSRGFVRRRRRSHGQTAHTQVDSIAPRGREDGPRRGNLAEDGPGPPPGCDGDTGLARVRADAK